MGNMLPCLVQGGSSSILPPMNTKHWSRSMKLLARTLRRSTNKPRHRSNNVKAAAGSTVTSSAADQATPRTRKAPRSGGSTVTSSAADQATPRTRKAPRSGERQSRRAAVVRVKVVLTRAEAVRLLSLTAHGHRTAAEVVGELKRMQAATGCSRASTAQVINELKRMEELVVARTNTSPSSASTPWRPVLESIPEESQYVGSCVHLP